MYTATYRVWLWLDPVTSEARYVGYGNSRYGVMPWDREWDNRGGSSPVSLWLATLERPPLLDPTISDTGYYRADAARYAAQVRKGLNAKLLSNRSYSGTQRGGGKAQAVIDPDGDMFVSVRAAARDRGLDVGTIVHYLKHSADTGWRYVNDDHQAKRASPTNCCALCHKHGSQRELIAPPEWSPSAICKKCNRIIRRLQASNEFVPELMRNKALTLRRASWDELTEKGAQNKRRHVRRSQDTGLPKWLDYVASLIESHKSC